MTEFAPSCCANVLLPLDTTRRMILVVAAVLIDAQNRVLLAQRPAGKDMAGLWEFPGGKINDGELPETALVRELREELGIETAAGCLQPLTFSSYAYPNFHLLMPIFACRIWQGTPHPREGQNLVWAYKNEWRNYPMPPADDVVLPILFELL